MTISIEELLAYARTAREETPTVDNGDWPNCFAVSSAIQKRLVNEAGLDPEFVLIREVFPDDDYRHYVLEVISGVEGGSILVDASFDQFGENTETPISVSKDPDPIVTASPPASYIFYTV